MVTPAVQEAHNNPKKDENRDKKKTRKSRKGKDKDIKHSKKCDRTESPVQSKATTGSETLSASPPARSHFRPELVNQPCVKAPPKRTQQSASVSKPLPGPSGILCSIFLYQYGRSVLLWHLSTGMRRNSFAEEHFTESEVSSSLSEPVEDLDTTDKTQLTEDMNYRETVRSVRSFMGWNHIPLFEPDFTEPNKSNNPWKGKNPFIKVPKSKSRWYTMHMLRSEEPNKPRCSVFSWHNTEAKVNSQFPRITKASAYPSAGPPSRQLSQESLRRWERCAREDSYIVNHAASFSRCSMELQERMSQHISMLSNRINKGKAPKEVSGALTKLKDLMAFHQNVSVTMGTALHSPPPDSLFVHLANLILGTEITSS